MALPLLPLLILGGGAALYFVSKKASPRGRGEPSRGSCASVSITQDQANQKTSEIMSWVAKWRDKPNASAMEVVTDFCRVLWPECAWPPANDRSIRGTDGVTRNWSEIKAELEGKTVAQAADWFRFGAMEAVDASGLSASQGPGVKGIT